MGLAPHGSPLGSTLVIHLLESSRVFPHRFHHGFDIFWFQTPIIANDRSVLIISMSTLQWCTLSHHLGYFYLVKVKYSCKKTGNDIETCGIVDAFHVILCNIVDGYIWSIMTINR